jgi:ArsR family transcriptional regulator
MQTKNKRAIKKELKNNVALEACAREFGVVGDPTRLKICYLLCRHKELSVSEIAELVGVSISAVSHTLRKLQEADIVENRRDFRNVYYQLKKTPFVKLLKDRLQ